MKAAALFIATAAFSGHFPIAPGTAGSAVALALFFALRSIGGPGADALAIPLIFAAGTWASGVAERHFGREDPGQVVVDEVLGTLVTLAFLPVSLTGALAGFLLFRVFDIVKPWPVNRLESLGGGLGIMADDAMAGLYAHAMLRFACWTWPAWMLAR
jgi:phosphatidylglycerophosphatase A